MFYNTLTCRKTLEYTKNIILNLGACFIGDTFHFSEKRQYISEA